MDIKVNEISFKGLHSGAVKSSHKLAKLLLYTGMSLGLAASCQTNNAQKDSFNKNAEYITLDSTTNRHADTKQIINTLNQTKFFPQEDSKIISSILATLGVETLGCISTEENMEAFGECSKDLYKFYVRKSDNNVYYGIAEKLVGIEMSDWDKPFENKNKSYAFVISNLAGKNPAECKQVTFAELKNQDDEYCTNFIFGDEVYNKKNDIMKFQNTFLSNEVQNIVYNIE